MIGQSHALRSAGSPDEVGLYDVTGAEDARLDLIDVPYPPLGPRER